MRFSPIVAKAAIAAKVARERRVERRDGRRLDIAYRVSDPLEIVRWSMGWGTEAEVVAPAEARAGRARRSHARRGALRLTAEQRAARAASE